MQTEYVKQYVFKISSQPVKNSLSYIQQCKKFYVLSKTRSSARSYTCAWRRVTLMTLTIL